MKTKIIYISGNEIFDMNDIRAAFEEVRNALNLDKNTVLFGVPVDFEDAGLIPQQTDSVNKEQATQEKNEKPCLQTENIEQPVVETEITVEQETVVKEPVDTEITQETTTETEQTVKKRGRPRKETVKEEIVIETPEQPEENIQEPVNTENIVENNDEEKVVPILSVLSVNEEDEENTENTINQNEEIDIIAEISEEVIAHDEEQQNETLADNIDEKTTDSDEEDLEKLLSAMTPLQEDVLDKAPIIDQPVSQSEDISVDATLQQLASEFAENQDKIASSTKSSSRSKIGKLRNILPFKQSKHKDQGLGDLFGWAGVAANDEDFSVPGFFTNVASKK